MCACLCSSTVFTQIVIAAELTPLISQFLSHIFFNLVAFVQAIFGKFKLKMADLELFYQPKFRQIESI